MATASSACLRHTSAATPSNTCECQMRCWTKLRRQISGGMKRGQLAAAADVEAEVAVAAAWGETAAAEGVARAAGVVAVARAGAAAGATVAAGAAETAINARGSPHGSLHAAIFEVLQLRPIASTFARCSCFQCCSTTSLTHGILPVHPIDFSHTYTLYRTNMQKCLQHSSI
ncbi:hypothetical protein ACK3TF_005680 [Chlorella vulgaris]